MGFVKADRILQGMPGTFGPAASRRPALRPLLDPAALRTLPERTPPRAAQERSRSVLVVNQERDGEQRGRQRPPVSCSRHWPRLRARSYFIIGTELASCLPRPIRIYGSIKSWTRATATRRALGSACPNGPGYRHGCLQVLRLPCSPRWPRLFTTPTSCWPSGERRSPLCSLPPRWHGARTPHAGAVFRVPRLSKPFPQEQSSQAPCLLPTQVPLVRGLPSPTTKPPRDVRRTLSPAQPSMRAVPYALRWPPVRLLRQQVTRPSRQACSCRSYWSSRQRKSPWFFAWSST